MPPELFTFTSPAVPPLWTDEAGGVAAEEDEEMPEREGRLDALTSAITAAVAAESARELPPPPPPAPAEAEEEEEEEDDDEEDEGEGCLALEGALTEVGMF